MLLRQDIQSPARRPVPKSTVRQRRFPAGRKTHPDDRKSPDLPGHGRRPESDRSPVRAGNSLVFDLHFPLCISSSWDYCIIKKYDILWFQEANELMDKKSTLMTSGSIWKQILLFSIPLILGNLFQQMYSVIDSIIVGRVIGANALAAVGASGSIIQLLIGFIIGASAGAGVVTSQYYGAQNAEGVRKAVHTTFAIAIVCGVIISVVGVSSTG